jgi:hypothetical protein
MNKIQSLPYVSIAVIARASGNENCKDLRVVRGVGLEPIRIGDVARLGPLFFNIE